MTLKYTQDHWNWRDSIRICRLSQRPSSSQRPPNTGTEMYAGCVSCCPLVSHVK